MESPVRVETGEGKVAIRLPMQLGATFPQDQDPDAMLADLARIEQWVAWTRLQFFLQMVEDNWPEQIASMRFVVKSSTAGNELDIQGIAVSILETFEEMDDFEDTMGQFLSFVAPHIDVKNPLVAAHLERMFDDDHEFMDRGQLLERAQATLPADMSAQITAHQMDIRLPLPAGSTRRGPRF